MALLLPRSNPLHRDSAALRFAAFDNSEAIVAMLLPLSDAKACDSEALQHAATFGNDAMINM